MSDEGPYFIVLDPEDYEDPSTDLYMTTTLKDARETLYNKCKQEFTGKDGVDYSFRRTYDGKSIEWTSNYPNGTHHEKSFRIVSRAMQDREFNFHRKIRETMYDVDPLGRFPEQ